MHDFVILEGLNDEEIVVQRSQISSIISKDGEDVSTIIMINGTKFDVKGSARSVLMMRVGTKQA